MDNRFRLLFEQELAARQELAAQQELAAAAIASSAYYPLPPQSAFAQLQAAASIENAALSSQASNLLLAARLGALNHHTAPPPGLAAAVPPTIDPYLAAAVADPLAAAARRLSRTNPLLAAVAARRRPPQPAPVLSSSSSAAAVAAVQGSAYHDNDDDGGGRRPAPDEAWDAMYKRLVRYRIKHGDCLVRERDDPKLGRWVRNQRNRRKKGRMTPDRISLLNRVGFVWCMVHQESWDVMFERLVAFKKKHGHVVVPRSYKPDPKLGRWVDTQRNKNRDDMSEERMEQLKQIGFVWKVHKQSWDNMFERLVRYKEKHGDCLVPSVNKEDPKLGTWVHVQRSRRSLLSADRKARLDSIGFVWCMLGLRHKLESGEDTQEQPGNTEGDF